MLFARLKHPIIKLVFNRRILFTLPTSLPHVPLTFVVVPRKPFVHAVALSLVILEVSLIVAHIVGQSAQAVHPAISPVPFVQGSAVFS